MNEPNYDQQAVRDHIMTLIEVDDTPVIGRTLFVYQMFYIFKEVSSDINAPFFPYQLGPYSNAVVREFNWLVENGYIKTSKKGRNYIFTCTEKGKGLSNNLSEEKKRWIGVIKKNAHEQGLQARIAITRNDYPEYMVNSRV